MNTVTINYGKICWHDHATKTIGPTTHQINWYCPDCGYTRTTYPTPGDSAGAPVQQAGVHVLSEVVRLLRKQGHYEDEEGEATNHLADLLAALKGEQPVVSHPATNVGHNQASGSSVSDKQPVEPSGSERGEVK